jgi:hypothetical protein
MAGILTTLLAGCRPTPRRTPAPDWDRFVAGFLDTYFQANPPFAVYQGRHEFDGALPDWTEAGLEAWAGRLHQLRDSASSFSISDADTAHRFERDYLTAQIDRDLFWRERADWPHRNPEFYSDDLDPTVYVARECAPPADRTRSFSRYAANLRTPMPRAYAEIAVGRFGGMAAYLKRDVPQAFAGVGDSVLRREFESANAGAIRALEALSDWLVSEGRRGTDAYALGPGLFREMLRTTAGVDLPLDSLERRGQEDLERNLASLSDACGKFVPGASVSACGPPPSV